MQSRRARVLEACHTFTNKSTKLMTSKWLVSRKHNFLYCPVEKVASTFWRRFLHQLEYTNLMSVEEVYKEVVDQNTAVNETDGLLRKLLGRTIKLLFVRDPYSRLFSAYVDKLLAPNPLFWKEWGLPAKKRFRSGGALNTTAEDPICGDDVTFQEFVSLALTSSGQEDPHVMAISRLCSPCDVNYTVIGKMETFLQDTRLLLSRLRLRESWLGLDRMSEDVTRDAVQDSVKDSMSESWLNESIRCVSKSDVVRRIWRKLQLRGFISWRLNYDMDSQNAAGITGPLLVEILKMAALASTNRTELKIQKSQAFLEAYRTLTDSQFAGIAKIFEKDFKLFDYSKQPEELSRSQLNCVKSTGAFDWTKSWNLKSVL